MHSNWLHQYHLWQLVEPQKLYQKHCEYEPELNYCSRQTGSLFRSRMLCWGILPSSEGFLFTKNHMHYIAQISI